MSEQKHRKSSNIIAAWYGLTDKIIIMIDLIRSHHPRHHSPQRRQRKQLWAGLTLLLITTLTGMLIFNLVGERFNSHIITALTNLTGGEVDIEHSSINILSDIRIKQLSVYQPNMPHEDRYLILRTSDLLLEYNPWSMLTRQLQINRIVANDALLNLSYDHDNSSWNITRLKPAVSKGQSSKGKTPAFIIRNSIAQFTEVRDGIISHPVQQRFSGQFIGDQTRHLINFSLTGSENTSLPDCIITGTYNPDTLALEADLRFDLAEFASEQLPPNLDLFRELYEAINPRGEVVVKSFYSPDSGNYVKVVFEQASARIKIPESETVIPLPQISGEIICTTEQTVINSVQVKYDDATFIVEGNVSGYNSSAEIDLKFSSPDLNIPTDQWHNFDIFNSDINDQELVSELNLDAVTSNSIKSVLKMLILHIPSEKRGAFNDFLPTGKASVDVYFTRIDGKNTVAGNVDLIEMAGRFIRFPYPIKNACGPISFEPGLIQFGPITGSDNGQSVVVNGNAVRLESGRWDIETDVDVKNVCADSVLYEALTDLQKGIFDLFKPSGHANAQYHINVIQGQEPDHYLNIQFYDCAGSFRFLPVALEDCYGNIHWDNRKTEFSLLHGKGAGGSISLSGEFTTEPESPAQLKCQIDFTSLNLNEQLIAALPANINKFNKELAITGKVSGTAKIEHSLEDGLAIINQKDYSFTEIKHDVDLHLKNGNIIHKDLPLTVNNVECRANFNNGLLTINDMTGEISDPNLSASLLALSGKIGQDTLSLKASCKNFNLSRQLGEYLEKKKPGTWQKYQPRGTADLELTVNDMPDKPLDYSCTLQPVAMSAGFMGYDLSDLRGSVVLTPTEITFADFSAQSGAIKLNGRVNLIGRDNTDSLNITINDLAINKKLKKAFGQNIVLLSDKYDLNGRLSTDLKLKLLADQFKSNTWQIDGTARLVNTSGRFPTEVTDATANFDLNLDYNADTHTLAANAQANIESARLSGWPIENAQASISYDSISKDLAIELQEALFCSGKVAGYLEAEFLTNSYSLDLALRNAQLNQIAPPDPNKGDINGIVDGFLKLNGNTSSARGNFEFEISKGKLGKLPLLAGILNLIKFTQAHAGVFNQASIKGDIVDDLTIFSSLSFKGNTIEVSGSGKMAGPLLTDKDKSGTLDLVFMIEAPGIIRPIPFVGSLFNAIRSGLIYVKAHGNYQKPEIETVPLSVFTDIFNQN